MKKGILVSFEGGEGCGKSTQVAKFVQFLKDKGKDVLLLREPGGTDVGEKIRQILLHDKTELSARTEFLLFSASRSKLIEDVVKPALDSNKIVVLDRFFDSSFVYQGYAGNLDLRDIDAITKFATGGDVVPDVTFLLDIPCSVGMQRKKDDVLDRIESKGQTFHEKVREGYLDLAKKNSNRIVIVDASDTIENVSAFICAEFDKRFDKSLVK